MPPRLPPPDPHEPFAAGPPPDMALPAPMAIYITGPPSRDGDRIADAILELRPGALFVAARPR